MNAITVPPPLDPLRRFVEASHWEVIPSGQNSWTVSTNEEALLSVVREIAGRRLVNGEWSVVINRDDALEDSEPGACVRAAGGVLVTAGEGCIVAIDSERSVVYGFVGCSVPLSTFRELTLDALKAASGSKLAAKGPER